MDGKYFWIYALVVPPACAIPLGEDAMQHLIASEFTLDELERVDLTGLGVKVNHSDVQQYIGRVVKKFTHEGGMYVIIEIPPTRNTETPDGKLLDFIKRGVINGVVTKEAPSVSMEHAPLPVLRTADGMTFFPREITEISIVEKPGRKGSDIISYEWSDKPFLGDAVHFSASYPRVSSGLAVKTSIEQFAEIGKNMQNRGYLPKSMLETRADVIAKNIKPVVQQHGTLSPHEFKKLANILPPDMFQNQSANMQGQTPKPPVPATSVAPVPPAATATPAAPAPTAAAATGAVPPTTNSTASQILLPISSSDAPSNLTALINQNAQNTQQLALLKEQMEKVVAENARLQKLAEEKSAAAEELQVIRKQQQQESKKRMIDAVNGDFTDSMAAINLINPESDDTKNTLQLISSAKNNATNKLGLLHDMAVENNGLVSYADVVELMASMRQPLIQQNHTIKTAVTIANNIHHANLTKTAASLTQQLAPVVQQTTAASATATAPVAAAPAQPRPVPNVYSFDNFSVPQQPRPMASQSSFPAPISSTPSAPVQEPPRQTVLTTTAKHTTVNYLDALEKALSEQVNRQ